MSFTWTSKKLLTLPHKKLIYKLDSYNIREELINWIEAFLIDRKQKEAVNGKE